ncbi:cytochrome P450 oxidoreductase [Sarocladium strictum]
MAELDTLDVIVLGAIFVGTVAYFTKGKFWGVTKDPYAAAFANANGAKAGRTRNIVEKMEESGKNCIIFYGSQTGTAEDYASRLAKEGKSRFGLETMVADLEEYDFDNLDTIPNDKVVMFVLATYGEGEPTDNAVEFYEFITGEDVSFSEGDNNPPLSNLNFVAFGLGNNTYEHYNSMVRNVNKALEKLGAHRIGEAGEGDDGAGTMEEDFLAWKDPMWESLAKKMGLEEREAVYEPIFGIVEREGLTPESPEVYLGEPNKMHLEGSARGPFNSHNPYIAPIAESREIFSVKDRNCLHLEVDISASNLSYQTGDHIAVWPTNPGDEVDRFLEILGLTEKRKQVISVKALEPTAKVPFPTPTTFDAIVRYHLEICAPVSRQFVSTLAAFAPSEAAKAEMVRLGGDKDYFHDKTGAHFLNISRLLAKVSNGAKWDQIPFSAFIEGITKLQPRYYSISSSSLVQPKKISITAVVENQQIPGRDAPFRGVATNYLFALKQKQNGDPSPEPFGQSYEIHGPRNKYDGIHVPVHVRHSNFKLPSDPSRPIIMVGPGTGVAPFRGFIQERAKLAKEGANVGRTLLFFGCRKRSEDFLYEKEWEEYKEAMGDKFEMINAFSRETSKKVYVQHRLQEHAKEVGELLSQKAFFYVCGDAAHMAREVNAVLAKIIAEARGVTEAKAEEIVKSMRAANQYQVCDWHLSLTSLLFSHDALPLHPNYFLTNLPGGRLVLRQYSTRSTTFGRNSRLGFQQGLSGLGLGSSTAADKEHELE